MYGFDSDLHGSCTTQSAARQIRVLFFRRATLLLDGRTDGRRLGMHRVHAKRCINRAACPIRERLEGSMC